MKAARDIKDLKDAIEALETALTGVKENDEDLFCWGIGFALGRLTRVRDRFYPAPPTIGCKTTKEKPDAPRRSS